MSIYEAWNHPRGDNVSLRCHDVTGGDNAGLGLFDRVVSFEIRRGELVEVSQRSLERTGLRSH